MASIYKRKSDRNRKGAAWYIAYVDENGKRRYLKGCADRQATERIAAKLESDVALRLRGVLDAAAERCAEHGKRPIAEHIEAYERHLTANGRSEKHIEETIAALRDDLAGAGIETLADLDSERIEWHLHGLRSRSRRPIGARSYNKRLGACKALGNWLVKDRKLPSNPLNHLSRLNEQTDRRRMRRALSDDELQRLIASTEGGPERAGLSGADRAMAYFVLVSTGFRRSELNSLTVESFDLDADPPAVTVKAAYSKRRRDDRQDIRRDVAEHIRPWLASKPRGAFLWRLPHNSAVMFRADLEAVGVAYVDDAGRVADLHSLRHTYITRLASAGVPVKIAQELARHSTITLTMDRYAHVGLADKARALDALPSLGEPAELAATGTTGATARNTGRNTQGAEAVISVHDRSQTPTPSTQVGDARNPLSVSQLCAKRTPRAAGCESEADGTRTRNHRIDSPVL